MKVRVSSNLNLRERRKLRTEELRKQIFSARMKMEPEQLYLYAILAAALSGLATLMLMMYLSQLIVPFSFLFVFPAFGILIITIWLAIAGAAVYGAYSAILLLPKIEASSRGARIDVSLFNTTTYLYTLHHSGETLYPIIKSLATHANLYGESATEFKQLISDCERTSMDIYSAILRLSETTPSNKFRFFLTGLSSAAKTIGTADDYLYTKIVELREEKRVAQKIYLNTLGVIAEMYITIFVAGPLFIIIVVMVMGMLSSADPMILGIVIYVMLPFGTAIFLLLLDMISDQSSTISSTIKKKYDKIRYRDIPLREATEDEAPLYAKLAAFDKNAKLRSFLNSPLEYTKNNPETVFLFSVPIAVIVFLVLYITFVQVPLTPFTFLNWIEAIEDILFVMILIILAPYAAFYSKYAKKKRKVEEAVPEFAEQMASSIRHNMTIPEAVDLMAKDGKSNILDEIRIMQRMYHWNELTSAVFQRFSEQVMIPAVDRMVILISEAERFTNHLSSVFDIIAEDAKNTVALKDERRGDMLLYVTITYMAFFVFCFVQMILVVQFLPIMVQGTDGMSMIGTSVGGGISLDLYNRMIYHSMIIHGFCSGLVAGMMGEGSVKAGVKHACIMMGVAIVVIVVVKYFIMV